MRILSSIILMIWGCSPGMAQEHFVPDSITETNLNRLKKKLWWYESTHQISFEVHFKIASANIPTSYLDSSKGICKYYQGKSWYSMSGMEVFQDTSISLVVFEEDKLIYLTKPDLKQAGTIVNNPLDLLLNSKSEYECIVQANIDRETFIVRYKQPIIHKEITFSFDRKGRLVSLKQIVNQAAWSGGVVATGLSEPWLILDTQFSGWTEQSGTDSQFSLSHYIIRSDVGEYRPSARLADYTVFIAHPSLQKF